MLAIARAPVRIGLAGGGSDLPAWTREQTGFCLSLAIDRRTHALVIDRDDGQVIVAGRRLDEAAATTEIAHGLARESLLLHGFEGSVEVHIASQLTSRGSGLGVSSSIAVALAAALGHMRCMLSGNGDDIGDDRADIAKDASHVEIERLRRPIGRQDHMAAAWGGLRLYRFDRDRGHVERTFTEEDARWVAGHLLLIQLPDGHDSRVILSNVKRSEQVRSSFDAVPLAIRAIEERDPSYLGRALDMCHLAKKSILGAVPASVAEIVDHLQCDVAGVYGCKVAGAGGGGHLVVCCDPGMAELICAETGLTVTTVTPDMVGVRSEGWA